MPASWFPRQRIVWPVDSIFRVFFTLSKCSKSAMFQRCRYIRGFLHFVWLRLDIFDISCPLPIFVLASHWVFVLFHWQRAIHFPGSGVGWGRGGREGADDIHVLWANGLGASCATRAATARATGTTAAAAAAATIVAAAIWGELKGGGYERSCSCTQGGGLMLLLQSLLPLQSIAQPTP